jgi:1-acyl-sn-glycerol-3-phosphate acyltransferase
MKISDVVTATPKQVAQMPTFDMNEMPRKCKWFLRPVAWLLAFPETIKHHVKIRKHGIKGIKPPYVLLCNHNSFFDFKVATRAIFPHMANYIVAIDGLLIARNCSATSAAS